MNTASFGDVQQEKVLEIVASVRIPLRELSFSYARASGAGGQYVNKVNSKVLLSFDLEASSSLTESEKKKIYRKLAGRITQKGVLHVVAMQHRSQTSNRQAAIVRFAELLRHALVREKKRIPTKIPSGSRQMRLNQKKRRAAVKRIRHKDFSEFD